jgi:RNA polymerase sporulation-specific sigma factor
VGKADKRVAILACPRRRWRRGLGDAGARRGGAGLLTAWLFALLLAVPFARGILLLAGHLTGNAFPQPLTAEEEREALEALRRGDPEAQRKLVEHNLRLVAHLVKKFENTGEDPEDLIDIGAIGLIKAVRTFDPDKGVRLATYAARCIENEILMHLRATRRSRADVSLYEPVGTDREGNEIALIEVLGTDPDAVAREVETQVEVRRLGPRLARLDPKERQVVEMRYGLRGGRERTQREVARALGISRSYVSRIEKHAVMKLARDWQGGDPPAQGRRATGKGRRSR